MKKLLMLIILLSLKKNETNHEALKIKVNDRVRIAKHKSIFSKDYTESWLRELLLIMF